MQVNMLGGMGPESRSQYGFQSNEELFDPLKNMQAARQIDRFTTAKAGMLGASIDQVLTPITCSSTCSRA